MKKLIPLALFSFGLVGCGGLTSEKTTQVTDPTTQEINITNNSVSTYFSKATVSSDSHYLKQWHLNSKNLNFDGSTYIETDADINISAAWDTTAGNGIKIAIIDRGIDFNHEDLKNGLYKVQSVPSKDIAHGTQCTGIVGARQNGKGSIGIAPSSEMIFIGSNLDTVAVTIQALQTAANLGADVINNSWGSYHVSDAIEDTINDLATNGRDGKGIVIVFANGNDSYNLDTVDIFNKEKYNDESEIPSVIGVGAIGVDNNLSSYSNYGKNSDLVAPGGDGAFGIVTADLNNQYTDPVNITGENNKIIVGTSFAAPIVAGVAGLVLSHKPNLTAKQVREILERSATKIKVPYIGSSVDYNSSGHNLYYGHGKINAGAAIELAKTY